MTEDLDGTEVSCLLPRLAVASDEQEELTGPSTCWETLINQAYRGSVTVSFLNADPYASTCDSIELMNSVLEQRELTVEGLRRDGWVISFP
jgi:hypothetical protein